MSKITDLLSGVKVLEESNSEYNGHLVVKRDLAWGTYITAEGLTQSGGIVEHIWKKTLRQIYNSQFTIHNCLILGLGGGTVAKLVRKNYPDAKIVGVEIDPVMIELGNRHLALGNSKVQIEIADAYKFSQQLTVSSKRFDLIVVDLYQGDKFPEKFGEDKFLKLARSLLAKDGMAVFNRLYSGGKRTEAIKFGEKLEKNFESVEWIYPEANVMFLCVS